MRFFLRKGLGRPFRWQDCRGRLLPGDENSTQVDLTAYVDQVAEVSEEHRPS
jgi:hypothetical protein